MNIFDILGTVSKIPYDSMQKMEADSPKAIRLMQLYQAALPHINAILPLFKEAEQIFGEISPDVMNVLKAIKE